MTRISNTIKLPERPRAIIPTSLFVLCVIAVALGMLVSLFPMLTLLGAAVVLIGVVSVVLELRFPGILLLFLMVGYAGKDRALSTAIREVSGLSISPSEIVLLVTIALWLVGLAVGRKWRKRKWVPAIPAIGLLLGWTMIPFIQGMSFSLVESVRSAVPVYYGLFYFIPVFFLKSWKQFWYGLIWFVIALAVSRLIGILPLSSGNWFLINGTQWHILIPVFLFLSIPLFVTSKRERWIILPLWGISLIELIMIQTRAVWLALVVAVLAFLLLNGYIKRVRRVFLRSFRFVLPLLLVLGIAAYHFLPEKLETFWGLARSIFLTEDTSYSLGKVYNANTRLHIWGAILHESNQHPLIGIGLGTPWAGFASIDNPENWWGMADGGIADVENMARLGYANPHNTFVHVLLRMGWLGLILYALVWGQILWAIHRQSLRIESPQMRMAIAVLWVSTLYLLILGVFQPILETPHIGLMPWVFAGVAVALINISRVGSSHGGV